MYIYIYIYIHVNPNIQTQFKQPWHFYVFLAFRHTDALLKADAADADDAQVPHCRPAKRWDGMNHGM